MVFVCLRHHRDSDGYHLYGCSKTKKSHCTAKTFLFINDLNFDGFIT